MFKAVIDWYKTKKAERQEREGNAIWQAEQEASRAQRRDIF